MSLQNLFRVETKNGLKLEMYVFVYIINNIKTIQNLYNWLTKTTFLCCLYIQTMYKLYKMYTNVN